MEKQKVTLSLPRPLLKQAKIIAASQDKSLSQLMRESLEEKEGISGQRIRSNLFFCYELHDSADVHFILMYPKTFRIYP